MILILLSVMNFLLTCMNILKSYEKTRISFLFWLTSFFFVGVPFLVDSVGIFTGYQDKLETYLYLQDENFIYNFSSTNILQMIKFVLAFNIFFSLGERLVTPPKLTPRSFIPLQSDQYEKLLLFINYTFLFIFLLNYNGKWFVTDFTRKTNTLYDVAVLIICICTSVSLNFAINRKKFLAIINLFPSIFVSFVTAERPYLAPSIGVIFFWLIYSGQNEFRNLFKLMLVGTLTIMAFRLVRVFANNENFSLYSLLLSRDSATNVLYFVFQKPVYYENLTSGKATLFLLSTGIYQKTIFGERNFSQVDIPSILALDKFGWNFGTIHPTLYGWFFIDTGWYSMISAFILGLIISKLDKITRRYSLKIFSIFTCAFALFIFVAMRGSMQIAYAKSLYIFILGILILNVYKFIARNFKKVK